MAENWIMAVRSNYQKHPTVVVSLNCKTKPQDHHHHHHPMIINSLTRNRIVTLQLCVETKCLVLQLLHMNQNTIPESVREFFLEERYVFVGIDAAKTIANLESELGFRIGKKIDVRDLVKLNFPCSYSGRPGLKALARGLVGFGSWKPRNLCPRDMEAEVLDEEVVKFLCFDAYVVHAIGSKMLVRNAV
ncbi:PREDICTED: uncharacterized protein LOC104827360 [Tarenaya hassleriana]|uniref:uncharacterized protein LOC104827360 n=1 Tax=Tarenaya hassleriana TaxID=28532 RepID=UPI00053C61D6|nr:PREDICTED: uncharacterized protein LOC104827360 [Tarenaya hassleriana]